MVLYAAGVAVNLLIHIFLSLTYYAEPGYFVGYDRLGTWMIILSGAVVSLAMTAVFKCKHLPRPLDSSNMLMQPVQTQMPSSGAWLQPFPLESSFI